MQVVKETNELSKQKDRELQETLHQIQNEMGEQMREAVQYCDGDMQCQKTEYDRIRQEARDKWNAYKKMDLDGTDWDKVESQYYPDDTKIQALWEGMKNAPGKLVDGVIEGGDKAIRYIDDNSLGKIGDDAWEFGKKIASIPAEWLNKEIPADSFETALNNLGSMTGHDVGETSFYTIAGTATAALGGKIIQWIDGKWTPVKVGSLEPGNPASTSIIRNGERLVLNQGNLPTCGANSCAMVLDSAGSKYDLSKLMIDSKVGSSGAKMNDLATALNKQGLNDARFISKTSIEALSSATSSGNPVIVAMKLDRGYHAVVVDGVTIRNGKTVVAIRDPAGGRQYFTPIDEFKNKFTGQAIFTNSKSK